NDHFFWVDYFACLASFPWHTDKNVSRHTFPKSTEFNAVDYVVLVAHPALFQKFPEPFLCLVRMSRYYTLGEDTYPSFLHDDETDMDLFAFIQVVNPTKMRVVGRERAEGEEKLLDFTIGHVVLLLPVSPARAESELEASVDRLFDEGGSTEKGDSAVGGGHDANIEPVIAAKNVAVVTAERPIRHHKKKQAVTDASGSSHPPKKLKGDYGTSSGAATGGKSSSVLKELLASSILNAEVGVKAVATLPLVTSSVSTMPGHEGGHPTASITGINLRTIGASERFVISLDSSHHSSAYASGAEVDSIIRFAVLPPVMTEAIVTSHAINAPSVMVLEMGTKITSPVHASMFHDSNSTKTVKAYAAENERDSLNGKILELQSSVSAKDLELKEVNVVASSLKSQNDGRVDQVHALETTCFSLRDQALGYEQLKEQVKEFQDAQMNIVSDKVAKLDANLLEMALHLEGKFYPHILTNISGRRWLLTRGVRLAVVKCLNSLEYLTALGSAISRSIEKGMQDGLLADINHGKAALIRMKVLRILWICSAESPLADAPEVSDLQPDVEQLIIPIDRPKDQVVLVDPLSAKNLIGAASTSGSVPAAIMTTTALSTTFASATSVPPITIDDYDIVNVDG
ncbi:hypothetical protein Tco_0988465, partial [Tanacetum coccineum]